MLRHRSLSLFLGCITTFAASSLASAGTIYDVDFRIEMESGALAGKTYYGHIAFDDENLTGEGSEELAPMGYEGSGSVYEGLLEFVLNFEGETYDITTDVDYPGYPRAEFEDGELSGLDFVAEFAEDSDYELRISGTDFTFTMADEFPQLAFLSALFEGTSYGTVIFGDATPRGGGVVPTPAAAGVGLAMLGMLATRRNRRA